MTLEGCAHAVVAAECGTPQITTCSTALPSTTLYCSSVHSLLTDGPHFVTAHTGRTLSNLCALRTVCVLPITWYFDDKGATCVLPHICSAQLKAACATLVYKRTPLLLFGCAFIPVVPPLLLACCLCTAVGLLALPAGLPAAPPKHQGPPGPQPHRHCRPQQGRQACSTTPGRHVRSAGLALRLTQCTCFPGKFASGCFVAGAGVMPVCTCSQTCPGGPSSCWGLPVAVRSCMCCCELNHTDHVARLGHTRTTSACRSPQWLAALLVPGKPPGTS